MNDTEKQELISLLHFLLTARGYEKRREVYNILDKYNPLDIIICSFEEFYNYGNHDIIYIIEKYFYKLNTEEEFDTIISQYKDSAVIGFVSEHEKLSIESKIRLLKKISLC